VLSRASEIYECTRLASYRAKNIKRSPRYFMWLSCISKWPARWFNKPRLSSAASISWSPIDNEIEYVIFQMVLSRKTQPPATDSYSLFALMNIVMDRLLEEAIVRIYDILVYWCDHLVKLDAVLRQLIIEIAMARDNHRLHNFREGEPNRELRVSLGLSRRDSSGCPTFCPVSDILLSSMIKSAQT